MCIINVGLAYLPIDLNIYELLAFSLNTSPAINTTLNRFNLHNF